MVGASGGLWIFIRAFLPVDQPRQTPCQELGEVLTEWILFQVGIKAEHTLAWGYGARGIEIFLQLQDSLAVRMWELTHTHTFFTVDLKRSQSQTKWSRERRERECCQLLKRKGEVMSGKKSPVHFGRRQGSYFRKYDCITDEGSFSSLAPSHFLGKVWKTSAQMSSVKYAFLDSYHKWFCFQQQVSIDKSLRT